jgi:hypothetical protein
MYNGGVYAFPARAFRSIAWKKPITGIGVEFGSAKLNSLLDSFRMCFRRGLEVEDMVRRHVKTYIKEFSESSFQAWLKTPVSFGGFGGGMSGRCELHVISKRIKNIKIRVDGMGSKSRLWETAARLRVSSASPIPGIENTYSFCIIRGTDAMPKMEVSRLADSPVIRIDWEVRDLEEFPDAYTRKLELEWKLDAQEVIQKSDLPRGFLALESVNKAYRRYRKIVGKRISSDSVFTASESFVRINDWINRAWAGVCLDWSLEEFDEWKPLWDALASRMRYSMRDGIGFITSVMV